MRELVLLPGTVVTVDVTAAPVPLVCTRIDAAIRRKLFKVLAAHVEPNEIAMLSPKQLALVTAAFDHFRIDAAIRDDALQSLGDTLRAGIKPVALRCTSCGAWHVDTGAAAIQVTRERTCSSCGATFRSTFPVVSHPLSLLQPQLHGTHLRFLLSSLPDVSAAFDGMDHLALDSGITTLASALSFL